LQGAVSRDSTAESPERLAQPVQILRPVRRHLRGHHRRRLHPCKSNITHRYLLWLEGRADLNLIFLAEPTGDLESVDLTFVDLADHDHPLLLPPVVEEIVRDLERGWSEAPRWLGNVWDESGTRRRGESAR